LHFILVFVAEHNQLLIIAFLTKLLKSPILIDLSNFYDPIALKSLKSLEFIYEIVGGNKIF